MDILTSVLSLTHFLGTSPTPTPQKVLVLVVMTSNSDDGGDDKSLLHSTPFTSVQLQDNSLRWANWLLYELTLSDEVNNIWNSGLYGEMQYLPIKWLQHNGNPLYLSPQTETTVTEEKPVSMVILTYMHSCPGNITSLLSK